MMVHPRTMAAIEVERKTETQRFDAALQKMRDGVQALSAWVY